MKEEAIRKIEAQQAAMKTKGAAWYVGEQLKDICRKEPKSAELIAQDLNAPEMSITEAEKKIKKWADAHKTGNFAFVPPEKAEEILRKFYGLSAASAEEAAPAVSAEPEKSAGIINLADFL